MTTEPYTSESPPVSHAPIKGVLYGSVDEVTKLKKRIYCASQRFGLSWEFKIQTDPLKAVDAGVTQLPSLMINGYLIIEGLLQTEEIEVLLHPYLIHAKTTYNEPKAVKNVLC